MVGTYTTRGGGGGSRRMSDHELGVVDEDAGGAVVRAAAEELTCAVGAGEGGDEIEVDGAAGESGGLGAIGVVLEAEGDVEGGLAGVRVDGEGVEAANLDRASGGGGGGGPRARSDDEVADAAVGLGLAQGCLARRQAEADRAAA